MVRKILEIGAWMLMIVSFIVAIVGMNTLPDTIATHFAANGEADGYGSPASLLVFPIIMMFSMGIISLVVHMVSPELWNMPFKVKEEMKERIYRIFGTMTCACEFEMAVFTLFVQIKCYHEDGTGVIPVTIVFLGVLMFTIVGTSIYAYRKQEQR